ncbi:hypothetical protein BN1012_Phect2430 [Candidatus Phaeomarinobacter ectocarpi]|uniref:Uncharacterized protein n=1 Tax=Candidatus Phaeomarinibacter ectocarpi TaxID=1458461 RepID=X5MA66_9HYPH|nr:hypothetical protein BN1012_Phect2430 [Candidatus Phaeomarinobacter ectocarpi]
MRLASSAACALLLRFAALSARSPASDLLISHMGQGGLD